MEARYEPLSKLVGLPKNPKLHNLGDIHQSIDRFGFVNRIIINDVTNHIIAGNGRVETLRQKKVNNEFAPYGIVVKPDDWYVPTDRISIPAEEEDALAIALNRIGENEWDSARTVEILSALAAKGELAGTGYDEEEVDYLLKITTPRTVSPVLSDKELESYREEKTRWRWIILHVMEDTFERWQNLKARLNNFDNDDQIIEFLLNLVSDEVLDVL